MRASDRWFLGPEFLKEQEALWPVEKTLSATEKKEVDGLELLKGYVYVTAEITPNVPILARLLGWEGLVIVAR